MRKFIYNFRKSLGVIFILALLLIMSQLLYNFLKQKHDVTYSIYNENITYNVNEIFDVDHYYLTIDDNSGHIFKYENHGNYNKQEKILNEIITKKVGEYTCIYPVFNKGVKNNILNINDIECSKDGDIYTSLALNNVIDLNEFKNELISRDIEYSGWNKIDTSNSNDFSSNISDNIYLAIWNNQNVNIISNQSNTYSKCSKFDIYDNKLGTLVDHYYIIPNEENLPTYSEISIVNLFDSENIKVTFETPLSVNSYINGVVDNKLYIFDKNNLIQYEIDPKEATITNVVVDNNAKYYDGASWTYKSIYDFKLNNIIFETVVESDKNILAKYNYSDIDVFDDYYYYSTNNSIYKVYKNDLDNPIMLLAMNDLKEIKAASDYIFFISGNILYYYHENIGIRPVYTNSEFNYNYKNIYDVYKK